MIIMGIFSKTKEPKDLSVYTLVRGSGNEFKIDFPDDGIVYGRQRYIPSSCDSSKELEIITLAAAIFGWFGNVDN